VNQMHSLAHEVCNGRLLLLGGGGYTLANVPRVWTVAFSALLGVEPSDEVPLEWSKAFKDVADEEPPESLYDDPTSDDERTIKETRRTVSELQTNLSQGS
jgi:acetoin utilization protein AcuC